MYQAGWSKAEIKLTPKGYAMHGFGQWKHRAWGQESPLMARTIVISDGKAPLIFCCLDLGYITYAMRSGIVNRLSKHIANFDEERLVLTCTHTHSGPGGCSHDAFYNVVTPGFVPAHVAAIISAAIKSIDTAYKQMQPAEISLDLGQFDDDIDVAWNRSLSAYNCNPDVTQRADTETHLALDREMQVLSLRRDGKTQALLSLFGVHATCCGNMLDKYSNDNKGKAAAQAEAALQSQGAVEPVAIFAQGTAGDVSPFYHGPGDIKRRKAIKGDAHYAYAAANAKKQSQKALEINQEPGFLLEGQIDGVLTYVDFSHIKADPAYANGNDNALTSDPCHGVAFFEGTPVDGPGMPGFLGKGARSLANRLRTKRLSNANNQPKQEADYYRQLYTAQGPKTILMEAARKKILGYDIAKLPLPGFVDPLVKEIKRQARLGAMDESAMVPTVLPLQIVRIGQLALVCCPGEFTTVAGKRIKDTVRDVLKDSDIDDVLISTYCNDYMGYCTTNEEYQQQNYEGGHTIFGQWQLAAFQTCFAKLAPELDRHPDDRHYDNTTRPRPVPEDELKLRTNIRPPKR